MKKGWKEKTLSSVLKLEYGKPLEKDYRKSDGLYPAYGANGEKARTDKYYHDKPSIIVGRKGSAGEINLTTEKFWPLDVTYFVTFDEKNYDLRFLFYLLTILNLPSLAKGVKPGINRNDVYSKRVKIPPIEEQKRIVSILDETFKAIDIAKANTQKNLQNARALFASFLNDIFSTSGPEWATCLLGNETNFIDYRGKTPLKTPAGIRLITAKNIKKGVLLEEPKEFIDPDNYETWMTRGIPEKGDILFTTEAPLGNVAQLDTDEKVAFAQRVIIIQPSISIEKDFLKYLLLSHPIQKKINDNGTGATVKGIKSKLLKLIEISFPKSITEQEAIVSKLNSLDDVTKNLESTYQKKLTALEELKKSLLHQAFNGGL